MKKTEREKNEIAVRDYDYYMPPMLSLPEILKRLSVAFVGVQTAGGAVRALKERLESTGNFKIIDADFEQENDADLKALKRRNFVFIDASCISQTPGRRVSELGIPFAKIKGVPGRLNDAELLECAMSNILYRFLHEEGLSA